ncbi:hypothetical protein IFM89_017926 [Coptis chinensis]|uniref:DYW domain-containing protein n=1 Tax=Coptis chinensis TaxID=261450 RepID=A0A835HWE0_9MAGN|nr:hypothetical protein IFM89_017926 [Coptis chinensis]
MLIGREGRGFVCDPRLRSFFVAFGILNLSSGSSIRVFKNLRVCGDCHLAIKFMSKIVWVQITLRDSLRWSVRLVTANNDAAVRVFDTENFACLGRFTFPWSVNNTSISPDGKLLVVLSDNVNCLIADLNQYLFRMANPFMS